MIDLCQGGQKAGGMDEQKSNCEENDSEPTGLAVISIEI